MINLWSNGSYILTLHGAPEKRPQWVRMFDENEKLLGWLKDNVSQDAVIAGQNLPWSKMRVLNFGDPATRPDWVE